MKVPGLARNWTSVGTGYQSNGRESRKPEKEEMQNKEKGAYRAEHMKTIYTCEKSAL